MKVEVVQFYPFIEISKSGQIGTLHVFIVDFSMHLRGIKVYFKDDKLHFFTPSLTVINPKTKTRIRFPIIDFQSRDQKNSLIEELQIHGTHYIRLNMKLPFSRLQKKSKPDIMTSGSPRSTLVR